MKLGSIKSGADGRLPPRRLIIVGAVMTLAVGGAVSFAIASSEPIDPVPPRGVVRIDEASPLESMSVFARAPRGVMPADAVDKVRALTSRVTGAPIQHIPGAPQVERGRLLLGNLGVHDRAFYAFPTSRNEICYIVSGLLGGCLPGFQAGLPLTIKGIGSYPPGSGPRPVVFGLAKDSVVDIDVIVNGEREDAIIGNNGWYYEAPSDNTASQALRSLVVELKDGTTQSIMIPWPDPRTLP